MYKLSVDKEVSIYDLTNNSIKYSKAEVISGENNIVLYDGKIRGLVGGENSKIKVDYSNSSVEYDIEIVSDNLPDNNISGRLFDAIDIKPIDGMAGRNDLIMAVDISTIYEVLRCGGKFYNSSGVQESIYSLLKKAGYNTIRLRHWNDPNFEDGTPYQGGHNDLSTNIEIMRVAKVMGFEFMLDLHYSDFWADPGKQSIPKSWSKRKTVTDIEKAVYDYTTEMLGAYERAECKPCYVQIGNEITFGMIKHKAYIEGMNKKREHRKLLGSRCGNFNNKAFIRYVDAGVRAVNDYDKSILTIIHIDRGADNVTSTKFYDRISSINYDIIGLSYYSFYHGSIDSFNNNIVNLAKRYNKKIFVAETSYAFTAEIHELAESVFANPKCQDKSWDISPKGQAEKLRDIASAIIALPNNLGIGLSYWEPAWLPVKGAGWAKFESKPSWSDQALFSYDGVALPSLNVPKMLVK